MINQISRRCFRNPKFWHIVVLSVTLIGLCHYFGTQTVTNINSISVNNSNNYNLPGSSATTNPNSFISRWDTSITNWPSGNSTEITLPLTSGGQYNFTVQWGDGSSNNITAYNQAAITHNYASSGIYTVNITGYLKGWEFDGGLPSVNNGNDKDLQKIIGISQWGNINLGNTGYYFEGCINLVLNATDALNLTGTTDLSWAFSSCSQLGGNGDMNGWDVSKVTNMFNMFASATTFNQPIGNWNVSKVTDMYQMFCDDDAFNQSIGNWDVSKVTDMTCMFEDDYAFNQPIGNWNVSNVTDMNQMFYNDYAFNQNIGAWNVSSVTDMSWMFYYASAFNQPIGNWNVSNVTDMNNMFCDAYAFNQPIENWDVSKIIDMYSMFQDDYAFNQNIGAWNVSIVTDMSWMFYNDSAFNQNIGAWNVSSVTDMSWMFYNDSAFSTENYGYLLLGWSQLTVHTGLSITVGSSPYYTPYPVRAAAAHLILSQNDSWSITDGGPANVSTPLLYPISSPSTTGNVTLDWSFSLTASSYSIYRSTSDITTLSGAALIADNITDNTYNDTNLPIGTYYYVILATNGTENSSISNCESVSVITIPSEPTNLNATSETTYISLTWEAPTYIGGSTILHYNIYRSTSANGSFVLIGTSTTTSYNDTNASAGQTYYYEVSAVNSAGASSFSNVANATASQNKKINGMGIEELISVSFVGVLVVAITIKKRKIT